MGFKAIHPFSWRGMSSVVCIRTATHMLRETSLISIFILILSVSRLSLCFILNEKSKDLEEIDSGWVVTFEHVYKITQHFLFTFSSFLFMSNEILINEIIQDWLHLVLFGFIALAINSIEVELWSINLI